MTLDLLFTVVTQGALILWVALALLPRNRVLTDLVIPVIAPAILGLLYLGLVLVAAASLEGGFGSLEAVRRLFRDPHLLLAGWVHFLAFDLFVGAWEARDARTLGISRWLLLPCLASTFLAGRYAFVVHHDVNDNGRNDRNWLGIPSEPSVFSRETRARFGPPSWERASFVLESRDLEVTVEVR